MTRDREFRAEARSDARPGDVSDRYPRVTLVPKVEFLRRPDSYPERPRRVEAVETHISWVFLTERHAYKLKKPVRHAFLDFSTVDARRRDCLEEVRLNRPLAPGVYLGAVPLVADGEGNLRLESPGKPVEWLVKMRRLPRRRMLDEVIRAGSVKARQIEKMAETLARFYRNAPPVPTRPEQYVERLASEVRATRKELLRPRFGVPGALARSISRAQLMLLRKEPTLFHDRARGDHIVEGHGDLRPEHICLGTKPLVIDRLEFNRGFRILDPCDELSFLAMECEMLGAPAVGRIAFATYGALTGDRPAERLTFFYKSSRACLRAKLCLWHIADPDVADGEKWSVRARDYLDLAEAYAGRF